MMSHDLLMAFSTVNSEEKAASISTILVEEGLVACVNIVANVRSIYRWQGKTCNEKEFVLMMKTTEEKKEALKKHFAKIHPYECPELVFTKIADGLPNYLEWISSSTGSPPSRG